MQTTAANNQPNKSKGGFAYVFDNRSRLPLKEIPKVQSQVKAPAPRTTLLQLAARPV